ncbi:MAG: EAL domain-containing protein [Rhodoferax sp.]|nr:EAL domain-containing protein [Rhodoferax sp.]MCF8208666.1 EAL domain-containing protein [Rhodoferax sp.]
MRTLARLKFREKVGLSFGILIGLMVLNALVVAMAAYSVVYQVGQRKNIDQIVREIDQIRFNVSRYVNTLSRESAQQIFLQVETTGLHIDGLGSHMDEQRFRALLSLLDDFKRNFHAYLEGSDQKEALKSRAVDQRQRLVAQLEVARSGHGTHGMSHALETAMGQILAMQWQGEESQSPGQLIQTIDFDQIRAGLVRLRQATAQDRAALQEDRRLMFRLLRDATDYLAGFESYQYYQLANLEIERRLVFLSEMIQRRCEDVSQEVQVAIQTRTQTAIGLMVLIFLVSTAAALVLNRYLRGEILRPIVGLMAVTQKIAQGDLQARADDTSDDEIGALSRSFNRMAGSLGNSQSQLLEKNQSLEDAQRELERRVDARTQELVARELILRQILDTAPIGIFLVDMTGRITQANQSMVDMFGYPISTLLTMEYVALVDPDELEMRRQKMLALMNSEIPMVDLDRKFVRANGQEFMGHLTGKLLRGVDGQKLGLVGVIADISERKLAEEKLQLAANVFTHAREGIMITDAHGLIVDVNDTFSRITGYSRGESLGRNPRFLQSERQNSEFYSVMWNTLTQQGNWSGEVWNRSKDGKVYAAMQTISAVCDQEGRTLHYVSLFSDITLIKDHQRQLEHIAHYDALTGLPNRLLLADRLSLAMAHCLRRNQALAVVYLDLDGFKAINDTHGHDVGDEVLVALAQRIKGALRESDTLARMGGDEFVVLLGDLVHAQDSEPLLVRLLQIAANPVTVTDKGQAFEVQVSASAGLTLFPQDDSDADLLLRHADQAMYIAKQSGRNRYHRFDLAQDEAIKVQRESVDRIRLALDSKEFVLFYQPKVNLRTGRVTGVEALIRWQHPERGLLSPVAFLPLIEDHPISIDIGEWVIDTALEQISVWHAEGLEMPVSINIGAGQLQMAGFDTRLAQMMTRWPAVPPHYLQLEVLETSALEDMGQVGRAIEACQAIGVGFALDDFGTGYSSLTYLKHLPAETLKIDQSFVRDMLVDSNDLAIVNGVIGLARAFGRKVIAEGVETRAHGDLLLSIGCELAQGYGIARPMPAPQVPTWVAAWHERARWTA